MHYRIKNKLKKTDYDKKNFDLLVETQTKIYMISTLVDQLEEPNIFGLYSFGKEECFLLGSIIQNISILNQKNEREKVIEYLNKVILKLKEDFNNF